MKIGMFTKTEENNENSTAMTTSKMDGFKSFVKRNKKKIIIGGLTAVGAFALKCVISAVRGGSAEDDSDIIETTYVDDAPEEVSNEE